METSDISQELLMLCEHECYDKLMNADTPNALPAPYVTLSH